MYKKNHKYQKSKSISQFCNIFGILLYLIKI